MVKLWIRQFSAAETVVRLLGEFFGTAILVCIGCLGCAEDVYPEPQNVLIPAFAFGFAAAISVMVFLPICGCHINPAVTVGAVVLGKEPFDIIFFYIPVQYLGAMLGYGLIFALVPNFEPYDETFFSNKICMLHVRPEMNVFNVFVWEAVGTWILVWLVCSLMDKRNEDKTSTVALRVGVGITALVLGLGPFSGCGINPARALPPAVFYNYYEDHWIFQFGPYLGGILAGFSFRFIFELDEKHSIINVGKQAEDV